MFTTRIKYALILILLGSSGITWRRMRGCSISNSYFIWFLLRFLSIKVLFGSFASDCCPVLLFSCKVTIFTVHVYQLSFHLMHVSSISKITNKVQSIMLSVTLWFYGGNFQHPDPIGSGLGKEAILEAAGPDCIVPGQIAPVKLLGLKVPFVSLSFLLLNSSFFSSS